MVERSGAWKTWIAVPTLSLSHDGFRKNHRASFSVCPLTSKLRITVLSLIGGSVAKMKYLKESLSMVPDTEYALDKLLRSFLYSANVC